MASPFRRQYLRTYRRRPAPLRRALDHPDVFDTPAHPIDEEISAASRDDGEINSNEDKPLKPPPNLIQPQRQGDLGTETIWNIILVKVIVITIVVVTVFICYLRKHRRGLARQRVFVDGERVWVTIRGRGQNTVTASPQRRGSRVRVGSDVSGMISISNDGRIRVDSNISGMISNDGGEIGRMSSAASHNPEDATNNDDGIQETVEVNRTVVGTLLSIPRAIGNALMYPLRLLEEGVNGWATQNYDEQFLRQFMERLEAEREAARENPDEREIRLKEAFEKECMVWVGRFLRLVLLCLLACLSLMFNCGHLTGT